MSEAMLLPSPAIARSALIDALPRLIQETIRINRLPAHGDGERREAAALFQALAADAIRTHRPDVTSRGYLVRGRTTEISVCRIPAEPRPGMPIALFLPGLLSWLPLAAVRALAFIDLFDLVLCELPGHGASGEVAVPSLAAFAEEYAALIDTALSRTPALTLIGESLGGLVALSLAAQRAERIRNVILLDTPFHLTRPDLAVWIADRWRDGGSHPFIGRICQEIMGFDPRDGTIQRTLLLHGLARPAGFGCAHLLGGHEPSSGPGSVVTENDIARLREVNPAMLTPPRIERSGHAVLLDNPAATRAALEGLLVPRPTA